MQPEKTLPRDGDTLPRWQQLLIENDLFEKFQVNLLDLAPSVVEKSARSSVIRDSVGLLTDAGQLVEMRILGVNGRRRTDSGYFDDLDKLAKIGSRNLPTIQPVMRIFSSGSHCPSTSMPYVQRASRPTKRNTVQRLNVRGRAEPGSRHKASRSQSSRTVAMARTCPTLSTCPMTPKAANSSSAACSR